MGYLTYPQPKHLFKFPIKSYRDIIALAERKRYTLSKGKSQKLFTLMKPRSVSLHRGLCFLETKTRNMKQKEISIHRQLTVLIMRGEIKRELIKYYARKTDTKKNA